MDRQQYYRGSSFHVLCMRGMLVFNNSLSPSCGERERRTTQSSNMKALKWYVPQRVFFFSCSWFDMEINSKGPKLVYLRSIEMNQQQTYKGQASNTLMRGER